MNATSFTALPAILAGLLLLGFAGCRAPEENPFRPPVEVKQTPPALVPLTETASSLRQWTGVAVLPGNRVIVCFPRWSDNVPVSVAELDAAGVAKPFPDAEWNRWAPGLEPKTHFVCVQSVIADSRGKLWVLDAASPKFKGIVAGGPKLIQFDPATRAVLKTIFFDDKAAPPGSYLNDVRIDDTAGIAYLTDSGLGALLVTNLATGATRRLLENDPSTQSEGITLAVGGKDWRLPDGSCPDIHADGIALDARGGFLYYQALTSRSLYRIPIRDLLNPDLLNPDLAKTDPAKAILAETNLAKAIEFLGLIGAADGLEFGPDGQLYLTALEDSAIKRFDPVTRSLTVIAQDSARLRWPDSLAFGPDGRLYVTVSQIHLGPAPATPYTILTLSPPPPPPAPAPVPAPVLAPGK